jgi:hypothetical protein
MIVYPAIFPLTGDRLAPEQAIGMSGLGDRHRPDSLIDFTGIRNLSAMTNSMAFLGNLYSFSHPDTLILTFGK